MSSKVRTEAKHARRRHNDIALARNFLNTLNDSDRVWVDIVSRILKIKIKNVSYSQVQQAKHIGIPPWFWPKIERIIKERNICNSDAYGVEYIYQHSMGLSTLREITFYAQQSVLEMATLLGIEIRCICGNKYALPVSTRCRHHIDIVRIEKRRPPKPVELKYVSPREIDMYKQEQLASIDAMLSKIPGLEAEIERLNRELATARNNLEYTRETIRHHLSTHYGI